MGTNDALDRLRRARAALSVAEERLGVQAPAPVGSSEAGCFHPSSVGRAPVLRLLARLQGRNGWVAALNLVDVGWECAAGMGVDLGRVVEVRVPLGHEADAAALLLPEVEVVCLGEVGMPLAHRRRLTALARTTRHVLLTCTPWHGLSRALPIGEDRRRATS